jgi:asparagine synthetase B (glutamine-hydrolysing)
MCGIAGFFGGSPSAGFAEHALRGLASRGPDGNGIWKSDDNSVALIHTRLAILDLSEASSQPMMYEVLGNSGQETENFSNQQFSISPSSHQLSTINYLPCSYSTARSTTTGS